MCLFPKNETTTSRRLPKISPEGRADVPSPGGDQQDPQNGEHDAPGPARCGFGVRPRGGEPFEEPSREPDEAARGDQLGEVVERPLDADVLRLVARREFGHVDAVGRDVVCGAAEGHDGQNRDHDREERRQVKCQSRNAEQYAAQKLSRNHEELLAAEKLQKRTPQKLDSPRPHDKRRPERYLRIRDTQILVHNRRNHVQHHERQAHRKIKRRYPAQRRTIHKLTS